MHIKKRSDCLNFFKDIPKGRPLSYYFGLSRIYYGPYYLTIGKRVANNPKPVNIPAKAIQCSVVIDPERRGEHSFVYVPKKVSKILYFRYNFAYRLAGDECWYTLPKLFSWGYKNGQSQIGLDKRFVRQIPQDTNVEIVMW